MIDDATIKRVWAENELPHYSDSSTLARKLTKFSRAIEQLARQEQREEDARICEEHWEIDGTITAKEFASAIRASGKENSSANLY